MLMLLLITGIVMNRTNIMILNMHLVMIVITIIVIFVWMGVDDYD